MNTKINTGWRCPECGKIWSPFVLECPCCNNKNNPNPPRFPWQPPNPEYIPNGTIKFKEPEFVCY